MARLNRPCSTNRTHQGARACTLTPEAQLRRTVMACLLWEDQFYEDGVSVAERLAALVPQVRPQQVALIAREARRRMNLRHVPLLLVREMARAPRHKTQVGDLLAEIIQRPDELTEFLAIYWKEGRVPVAAQIKKGLARAFTRFDAYQLAKYDRKGPVRLRDVLFLCHPKPRDSIQAGVWKNLADRTLPVPDTWEVNLSAGCDPKATWERLLIEKRLGAMALLRNLRNLSKAGVNTCLIAEGLRTMKVDRILPFRFIAAARHAPQWEAALEKAMLRALKSQAPFPGHTVLLIDVSGSMDSNISSRSEITRLDAACGVAMLLREICAKVDIFTFSWDLKAITQRRGFALRDAIVASQDHAGTLLGAAVRSIYARNVVKTQIDHYGANTVRMQGQALTPNRLIVITDEQSHDPVPAPEGAGYMVNVASYRNGVGYGAWTHVDGWSEAVVDFIRGHEALPAL